MNNMDQEFTEVDMNEINVLKQSVKACQSSLAKLQEGQSTELIPTPRPPVLPSSIVEPRPASPKRPSRSDPGRTVSSEADPREDSLIQGRNNH